MYLTNCLHSTVVYGFSKFPAAMFVLGGALAVVSLVSNVHEHRTGRHKLNWVAAAVCVTVVVATLCEAGYILHSFAGSP